MCVVGEGALRKVLFSTRKEGFGKWAMACSRRGYCELREIESDAHSNSVFDRRTNVISDVWTKNKQVFAPFRGKGGKKGHRKLGSEKREGGVLIN